MPRSPFQLADDATLRHDRRLACQRAPALFFDEDPAVLAEAKRLCADCPIRAACLRDALDRGEPWGVWGGEIVTSGRVTVTKRGRGRPRKDAAA